MKQHVKVTGVVMWLFQLPSRFCFYVRSRRVIRVVLILVLLILYCEFVHYYVVLLGCTWPRGHRFIPRTDGNDKPLRAMFIGDTHILGYNSHWFDKLRREWQLERSFQTSMLIHSPDVVFILGDLMDNGHTCSSEEFEGHIERFRKMFRTPSSTRLEVVVGNHDIGFHYMISERRNQRFIEAFSTPSVRLLEIQGVTFVMINSMALEGDGCNMCSEAEQLLRDIKWKLKCAQGPDNVTKVAEICNTMAHMTYTQPIILQHFPMYRDSDINCSTPDAAPEGVREETFRPKIDCLSKESTQQLFEQLAPRLVISAHTHHGCYRIHDNRVPEYTVASYNWRNKQTPSFFLAEISGTDFTINRCYLPNELTVICIYVIGVIVSVICLCWRATGMKRTLSNKDLVIVNKSH